MIAGPGADEPGFDEVAAAVASELGRPVVDLTPDAHLAGAVCRHVLDLYRLHLVLDRWLPGFALPEQLDLDHATLGDAHHYLVTRLAQGAAARPG